MLLVDRVEQSKVPGSDAIHILSTAQLLRAVWLWLVRNDPIPKFGFEPIQFADRRRGEGNAVHVTSYAWRRSAAPHLRDLRAAAPSGVAR